MKPADSLRTQGTQKARGRRAEREAELEEMQDQEKVVLRQYKLFSETILSTDSFISNDFVFVAGVAGVVYKLSKKDLSRLVHKQKEKLKGTLAKKILQVEREVGHQS